MILNSEHIREIMDTPRNGKAIIAGDSLQKEHKIHITGDGYKSAVNKVEGFESASEYNVRLQIAKPATIQITSIILDNLNRWTTAQGTVKKVEFKDEKKDGAFQQVLDQVWHGDSYEKFINTFYKEAIYTEFNGFILVTKPKVLENFMIRDGVIMAKKDGNLDPYMIFIAISDVYDFYMTGDKVEYLILKEGKETYRLIDDEKDVIFKWKKGGTSNVIPESGEGYLPNEIGYVPARRISAINDDLLSAQVKTSPIAHVIPALDRYFAADADLRMQFIRHNYPKLAIVTKECRTCHGDGKVNPPEGTHDMSTRIPCSACDGTGKIIPISRDGVIGLPEFLSQGDTAYPGSPASYITPDTESLRLGLDDLKEQREYIIYSGTGDKNLVGESLNTATENMINSRSLEDRIKEITQMVEGFEYFTKKAIKDLHKDFASIEDYSIVVRYGKRISIKNEDELLQEMKGSKAAGMPSSYIAALHKDLIYAKYKNNTQELDRQLLLADIEPLAGYTVYEVLDVAKFVTEEDIVLKVNFDSIIQEIELTTPLQYFLQESDYGKRLTAIKLRIDEILQKRVGALSLSRGQDVDPDGDPSARFGRGRPAERGDQD